MFLCPIKLQSCAGVTNSFFHHADVSPRRRSSRPKFRFETASLPPFSVTRTDSLADSVTGFGYLYPQASLKWNFGFNNFMTHISGVIPVGNYSSTRLANLGLGNAAIDAGGGYTYFNPGTGREFSTVAGFTYNFINPDTQYQCGVDFHLDWERLNSCRSSSLLASLAIVTTMSPPTTAPATCSVHSSRGYLRPVLRLGTFFRWLESRASLAWRRTLSLTPKIGLKAGIPGLPSRFRTPRLRRPRRLLQSRINSHIAAKSVLYGGRR
jgi:hypothetical protein